MSARSRTGPACGAPALGRTAHKRGPSKHATSRRRHSAPRDRASSSTTAEKSGTDNRTVQGKAVEVAARPRAPPGEPLVAPNGHARLALNRPNGTALGGETTTSVESGA
mmetsp:Transcript_7583/g.18282  ORF Transcript_7583/g.18282 Transcript_7583/m.18282 type:complete len:109 (+) Transcript_7583:1061-1387(+)